MFAGYRSDELHRPAAEMLRMLHSAGYDPTNEHELQMGGLAYNAALLLCKCAERPASVWPAQKSRIGRNEPCPCGSGKKYKKCCLDTDRAPLVDDDRTPLVRLEPEILPHLWDQDAVLRDCALLGRIMKRDRAFAGVGFSPEKVASFMDAVCEENGSLFGDTSEDDAEGCNQVIDDLAVRYIRESGESTMTWRMTDKFLAAARRAHSKAETRALATGICLALRAEATEDPEDDLLSIILFRRALFAAARPAQIVNKVLSRLGLGGEELRSLIEANDPSITEQIKSAVEKLSPAELEALHAIYDKRLDNLWDTIRAGEFPVPMPCATQIALVGQLASAERDETCSPDDVATILTAFSNDLIEDDFVLYGQMLDRWLENSKGQPDRITDAVKMMSELCGIRSIADVAPSLLMACLRTKQMSPLDEEERNLIDGHHDLNRNREFIAKYSSWLTMKGYPGMANRLRSSWEWESHASSESPDVHRPRRASVG